MDADSIPSRPPDFIVPGDLRDMSVEQFDRHIESIRVERLKSYRVYRQQEYDRKAIADENARVDLDKQYDMLGKDIATLDKVLERMCKRFVKVQALRLQLGIDIFEKGEDNDDN